MNKMLDAGVRVFKIEGRARGPEYVRTVVECYKEAIKGLFGWIHSPMKKIAAWDERLKTVFQPCFSGMATISGTAFRENGPANYGSAATERKIYVGKRDQILL